MDCRDLSNHVTQVKAAAQKKTLVTKGGRGAQRMSLQAGMNLYIMNKCDGERGLNCVKNGIKPILWHSCTADLQMHSTNHLILFALFIVTHE
jgi:hypothetical protein